MTPAPHRVAAVPFRPIVIAGKTTMAIAGAVALRDAADTRDWHGPVYVIPNAGDDGRDNWQPSLRKFAQETSGFEVVDLEVAYRLPDLQLFSLEFDQLIKTEMAASSSLFNMHFSLLPADKGMGTSIWPILEGRSRTGVTLHRIDRGIDTGAVIAQRSFDIGSDDTGRDLYLRYIEHGTALFLSMVERLLDGDFNETPQPSAGSTYHGRDEIDYNRPIPHFRATAEQLRNRIRAFTFPEYQTVKVDGLAVLETRISTSPSVRPAGEVIHREIGVRHLATIDFDLVLTGQETSGPEAIQQRLR